MSDSYTNLLYHIVFSTKDRRPIITPEHEVRLYDYIGEHHRKVSFRDEFIQFLKANGIEYDERYV